MGMFGERSFLGFVTTALARVSVPIFFIASGCFTSFSGDVIAKSARRLLVPYVFWFALYSHRAIFEALTDPHVGSVVKIAAHLVLTGGHEGYHLWFLPALFIGIAIVTLWCRHGLPYAAWIFGTLYAVAVLLNTGVYGAGPSIPNFVSQNGLMEAPIFLIIGNAFKTMDRQRLGYGPIFVVVACGLALDTVETVLTNPSLDDGPSLTFGVLIGATALFALAIKVQVSAPWTIRLSRVMMGAYCVHLAIVYAFAHWLTPIGRPWFGIVATILIATFSYMLALLLKQIKYVSALVR